jgi:hypothetical protein
MTGPIDWKKEMKNMLLKPLRTVLLAFGMATTAFVAVSPLQPAMAQARALPDFTDLVDQVGPSVGKHPNNGKGQSSHGARWPDG